MWRNGRRNGLKIAILAISGHCSANQIKWDFPFVNNRNSSNSRVLQGTTKNGRILAQILAHKRGGKKFARP